MIGNKNKDDDDDIITCSIILESVPFLSFDSFSFKEDGSIPDGSAGIWWVNCQFFLRIQIHSTNLNPLRHK